MSLKIDYAYINWLIIFFPFVLTWPDISSLYPVFFFSRSSATEVGEIVQHCYLSCSDRGEQTSLKNLASAKTCWHRISHGNLRLVGGLEHFLFFHILIIIIPIDELIFFRGMAQPPTSWDLMRCPLVSVLGTEVFRLPLGYCEASIFDRILLQVGG